MTQQELTEKIIQWATEKKAEDIVIVDISEKAFYADKIIIMSGNGELHVRAIANSILEQARENDIYVHSREGFDQATWVLLDFSDIIVHIFNPKAREFYNLEALWGREIIPVKDL